MSERHVCFGALQSISLEGGATAQFYSLPLLEKAGLGAVSRLPLGLRIVLDALQRNMEMEVKRNRSRYQFLKWGTQAFTGFDVVPPGVGICHQVNLEHLANGVTHEGDLLYPDTLVGTDSHTTMINGLGVVGW